ncbi:ATP-dependent helicase HrpB [Streptomyces sp. DW4-2]|uniref:ATP-dependent helicase HrpB n=1 Tax=Streptomyces spirodelae TaxID=2812904 RepID=A0ABS3WY33_9ACTN|nr:ATP-dependent helicase HrpB [Streptomyces spirodelae]
MEPAGVGRLVPAARTADPGHRDLRLHARVSNAVRQDEQLNRLPIAEAVPRLREALAECGAAVVHAPPGIGKTTLLPLALAGLYGDGAPPGTVLVAEPRRMAARSAARRMAWLLGEKPGESVGFTVRGERRVSARTRVEVVTTGVLLQRLQRDQELSGVDVVLMDECHERHLDADTALAFLLDVRATLRPELRLIAASATQDSQAWARLLSARVVPGRGTSHPVDIRYAPPPAGVRPPHGMWVDPALLRHVAATVRQALAAVPEGDVLCFLPGGGEIARVAGLLSDVPARVLPLHGRAPARVQDEVLSGSPGAGRGERRVILSTSVAESSLTVPGVRVVVDAGLAREPRTDHARGLGSLTTVRVSRAAAEQRRGRAGREAPGVAYACWARGEEAGRPREPSPEIAVADLTAFALQAACWGDPDAARLALLDAPPAGAMSAARSTLRALGALDEAGRVTARGQRMARLGVHPRLARALLDGAAAVGGELACETVALLSEEPPRAYGDDALEALRRARTARPDDPYGARWAAEVRRLRSLLGGDGVKGTSKARARCVTDEQGVGEVVALAQPERVARAQSGTSYLLVGGPRAELPMDSPLRGTPWLAVAVADRPVGAASARVRLAAPIDEERALAAASALHDVREEVRWDPGQGQGGDVVAREVESLGAVRLSVRPLTNPPPEALREAALEGLRRAGTGLLRWSGGAVALRHRLAFLHRTLGAPWPDVGEEALLERADEWLGQPRCRADLARMDAWQVLSGMLPWASGEAARLDELAPERIEVPSGSRVRIDYAPDQPVLAVKLQEMFGARETPRVADGRVPVLLHLLSPAGRPAAVTADLASFWAEGYRGVRAELRGRYPKHPWPEDPASAEPTRRTKSPRSPRVS